MSQYVVSKNKFYGRTLDADTEQLIYFERYLNTLNVRIVSGYDTNALIEQFALDANDASCTSPVSPGSASIHAKMLKMKKGSLDGAAGRSR